MSCDNRHAFCLVDLVEEDYECLNGILEEKMHANVHKVDGT